MKQPGDQDWAELLAALEREQKRKGAPPPTTEDVRGLPPNPPFCALRLNRRRNGASRWFQLPIMQSGPTSGRLVVDKTIP